MKNTTTTTSNAITSADIRSIFERISNANPSTIIVKPSKIDKFSVFKSESLKAEMARTGFAAVATVLPISKLVVRSVQREVNIPHVLKIIRDFDPYKVEFLVVNYNSTTQEWEVIDGQHTLLALTALGYTEAQCKVYIDLTLEQKLEIFVTQLDKKRRLTTRDQFNVKLNNGDKDVAAWKKICDEYGVTICVPKSPANITSVTALKDIWKNQGERGLRYTLQLIKDAGWTIYTNAYVQANLRIGYWSYDLCVNNKANYNQLISLMRDRTPEAFIIELKKHSEQNIVGHAEAAARALVTLLCS